VSQDERELGVGELTVGDVEVGAADPAGVDPEQELARPGLWNWEVTDQERMARSLEYRCAHVPQSGGGGVV
jgi:hypothetical protein